MPAPTVTGDFTAAGVVQQVVARHTAQQAGSVDAKLNAKLDAMLDPKTMPEPDVLRVALEIMVAFGYLTEEQAQTLLKVLTGGTFVNLPPLPAPEGAPVLLPLYDVLRVAISAKVDTVDSTAEDILAAIGHFLLEEAGPAIGHGLEAVAHAIVDFIASL